MSAVDREVPVSDTSFSRVLADGLLNYRLMERPEVLDQISVWRATRDRALFDLPHCRFPAAVGQIHEANTISTAKLVDFGS